MKLERAFLEGPGLRRFFGNHDLDWEEPDLVEEQLGPRLPGSGSARRCGRGCSTASAP